MRLSRQSRFAAALLALFSVFFTQLAVAGYACPSMQIAQTMGSIATMAQAAAELDHMPGCGGMDGMDAQDLVLCTSHGQVADQSLDRAQLPDVPPFMASMLVQNVVHADMAQQAATPQIPGFFLKRSTAPPLAIRHCCFLI